MFKLHGLPFAGKTTPHLTTDSPPVMRCSWLRDKGYYQTAVRPLGAACWCLLMASSNMAYSIIPACLACTSPLLMTAEELAPCSLQHRHGVLLLITACHQRRAAETS